MSVNCWSFLYAWKRAVNIFDRKYVKQQQIQFQTVITKFRPIPNDWLHVKTRCTPWVETTPGLIHC